MKFQCPHCQARYSIAGAKVRGKVLKIRCKRCSYIITVQGPQGAAVSEDLDEPERTPSPGFDGPLGLGAPVFGDNNLSAAPDISRAPVPMEEPLPQEQTRLSAAPDFNQGPGAEEWYLAVDGEQYGPMDHQELCARIRRGEASGEAVVWHEGLDDWQDIARVAGLPRPPPPAPLPVADRQLEELAREAVEAAPAPAPVAPPPELEEPAPAPTPEASTEAVVAHPGIPLLNKITAAGGITAGLCGLFLVAWVLFGDKPQQQAVPKEETDVTTDTTPPVEEPQKKKPTTRVPPLVVTPDPDRTHERKPGSKKQKKRTAGKKRKKKVPGFTIRPREDIPAPELVQVPKSREQAPPADLSSHVARHQRTDKKRIRTCYERAAKHDSSLETVKVIFTLDVGSSGVVRRVGIDAGGNNYLRGCLEKIVKHWTFPAGEVKDLTFKILFKGTGTGY